MHWTRRWISAMVAAMMAAPAMAPPARAQTRGPTTAQAGPLTPAQYISQLDASLLQGRTAQERNEAAQRLAEINTPESRQMLSRALSSNDRETQFACARAMAEQPATDPQWPSLLAPLLKTRQWDVIARALARYDENGIAIGALTSFVRSQAPVEARAAAARAMGRIVQRSVAETLVALVSDPSQPPAVRAAAADALEETSGQTTFGQDARKWSQWLAARPLDAAAFRQRVIDEQHPALADSSQRLAQQYRQFQEQVRAQLDHIYQTQPPADKPKMLMGFLDDPTPEIRSAGAFIISQALSLGQPIPQEAQRRLIDLVGDASPEVRRQVVGALEKLSNPDALDALLTQVEVEHDVDVRVEMCRALGVFNSDRAVPTLVRLLRDPSARVGAAAATAIRSLAAAIKANEIQAQHVIVDLRDVLNHEPAPPANAPDPIMDELRADIVLAMGSLAQFANPREIFQQFSALARDPSPRVRAAALIGLGSLGPDAADTIEDQLKPANEPDPGVRAAAAEALAISGSVGHANALVNAMGPDEPSATVRRAARQAFIALLPRMTPGDLGIWSQTFQSRRDVQNRIEVLKVLVAKLAELKDPRSLAAEQQTLGDLYLRQNQPNLAIPLLQEALNYYEKNNGGVSVPSVIHELMNAYLSSKRYDEAVAFAEKELRRGTENNGDVWPPIRDAAEVLIQQGANGNPAAYRDAQALIQAALALKDPPLNPFYQDYLRQKLKQIPSNSPSPTTQQ